MTDEEKEIYLILSGWSKYKSSEFFMKDSAGIFTLDEAYEREISKTNSKRNL